MGNINKFLQMIMFHQIKAMDIKGAEVIKIKTCSHEKKHHTVASACTASGEKLPLVLILQRKIMPSNKIPHSTFTPRMDGWMDGWMDKNGRKIQL